MQFDDFVGQVQHRARLANTDQVLRAVRATLETLGERLSGGAAKNLAAQLPPEIGNYLERMHEDPGESGEGFTVDEFFERVTTREGQSIDKPDAVYHARCVIDVLGEAVGQQVLEKVQTELPDEFQPLFTSGSEGKLRP